MARTAPDERRRQIIDGALQIFSTRGFAQATNKEIAQAAGIQSPGLIYHYFQDKADLLRAVIERHAPPLQIVLHPDELMALAPRDALTRLGLAYLRLLEEPSTRAFFKLAMSEALRNPAFGKTLGEIGPLRVLRALSDYLERQMAAGSLRRADPALAARTFLGPLAIQLLLRGVFQAEPEGPSDVPALVAAHIDLFLHGLAPESGSRP